MIEKILQLYDIHILVIDDGSSDSTFEIVKRISQTKKNVEIISHNQNKGLGNAINTGFKYALINNFDIIITMDSDDTHDPIVISRMIKELENNRDLVVASRFVPNTTIYGIPLFRKFLSYGVHIIFKTCIGVNGISDYSSGYRGYTSKIISKAYEMYEDKFIENSDFSCMSEIIVKLSQMNLLVSEVPIVMDYSRKAGKSKIKFIKTINGYIKLLHKLMSIKSMNYSYTKS